MFECKICKEKDKLIEILQAQNKDLLDRLLSFNPNALSIYKQETKQDKPLYPFAVDEKGKLFDYKDMDLEEANSDAIRAMGEQPIVVEDKND